MGNSREQGFVILRDLSDANAVPFGYKLLLRNETIDTSDEDYIIDTQDYSSTPVEETDKKIPVPNITDATVVLKELKDGTIAADATIYVDSLYDDVELRIRQGEKL